MLHKKKTTEHAETTIDIEDLKLNSISTKMIANAFANNPSVTTLDTDKRYLFSLNNRLYPYIFLNPINKIVLDPCNTDKTQNQLLAQLLKTYKDKDYFGGAAVYPIYNEDHQVTFCQLTNAILKRNCNAAGRHAGQYRYEVMNEADLLGTGGFGRVIGIRETLALKHGSVVHKAKSEDKMRAVKIQDLNGQIKYGIFLEEAQKRVKKEYKMTKAAGYMHVKKPVFFDHYGFSVMKRYHNPTLAKILSLDKKNIRKLSPIERINLCLAVLKTAEYLHLRGIIHLDIKPANILVCPAKNGSYIALIIDFGHSKHTGKIDAPEGAGGTENYVSPEAAHRINTSCQSDIYSLGCVIAEIFGCDRNNLSYKLWKKELKGNSINLNDLFTDVPGFTNKQKGMVALLIEEMTRHKPAERLSIRDVTAQLNALSREISGVAHDKSAHKTKKVAYDCGDYERSNDDAEESNNSYGY